MDFSPKCYLFLVSVTLTGLCQNTQNEVWLERSIFQVVVLFINLYPASRGPSIFLDKLGRLKRSVATLEHWNCNTGTILEPRTNRVSKHKNQVLSFQKPAFLYSPLETISGNDSYLEKHNNNHSHMH